MKKLFVSFLFLALAMTAGAASLEPIPEGTQLVIFLNNFSKLPVAELVRLNPFIPPKHREGVENFIKASGFNVFSDITSLQVFTSWEGRKPSGIGLLKGKFDVEKLTAWVKLIAGDNLDQITVSGQTILSDKKSRVMGLCFLDGNSLLFGFVPVMQKFLDNRAGGKNSPAFAEMLTRCNDNAYITVLFTGKELITLLLEQQKERMAKRPPRRKTDAFLQGFIMERFLEGLSLNYLMTHRLDDRGEVWVNYDRGDQKNLSIHLLMETTDQQLFVSNFFKMLAESLAKFTVEPTPEKPEPAPITPQ